MDIVWLEQRYMYPDYKRDARFRVALARGPAICLISMNYLVQPPPAWSAFGMTCCALWSLASLSRIRRQAQSSSRAARDPAQTIVRDHWQRA
jgi:hypothetical protein